MNGWTGRIAARGHTRGPARAWHRRPDPRGARRELPERPGRGYGPRDALFERCAASLRVRRRSRVHRAAAGPARRNDARQSVAVRRDGLFAQPALDRSLRFTKTRPGRGCSTAKSSKRPWPGSPRREAAPTMTTPNARRCARSRPPFGASRSRFPRASGPLRRLPARRRRMAGARRRLRGASHGIPVGRRQAVAAMGSPSPVLSAASRLAAERYASSRSSSCTRSTPPFATAHASSGGSSSATCRSVLRRAIDGSAPISFSNRTRSARPRVVPIRKANPGLCRAPARFERGPRVLPRADPEDGRRVRRRSNRSSARPRLSVGV